MELIIELIDQYLARLAVIATLIQFLYKSVQYLRRKIEVKNLRKVTFWLMVALIGLGSLELAKLKYEYADSILDGIVLRIQMAALVIQIFVPIIPQLFIISIRNSFYAYGSIIKGLFVYITIYMLSLGASYLWGKQIVESLERKPTVMLFVVIWIIIHIFFFDNEHV
ncbi:MAG: hypothetical protein R8G66_01340 [Cytophagales bacterium]|nr:hypothetical protein [Cytophagales bacterium]